MFPFKNSRACTGAGPLCFLSMVIAIAAALVPPGALAQTPGETLEPGKALPGEALPGEALEEEAQAIDRMIMCPVCPAETIDQAQVEISFQMRAVIREMLSEGKNREEILDYFVDRYGPDILAAPPKSGVNLLAWILPIVGVAAGLGGVFLVIRAMSRPAMSRSNDTGRSQPAATPATAGGPSAESSAAPPVDPELAPYLEIADRLLASRRAASAGLSPSTPLPDDERADDGPPAEGPSTSSG